jgi:hypothetical protein
MAPVRQCPVRCLLLCLFLPGGGEFSQTGAVAVWQDAVTFRKPEDALTTGRVTRSATWLVKHVKVLPQPGQAPALQVIAWKDPTLEPGDPKLLGTGAHVIEAIGPTPRKRSSTRRAPGLV